MSPTTDSFLFKDGVKLGVLAIFCLVLLVTMPLMVFLMRSVRQVMHTSIRVQRKLNEFDMAVCSYALGFIMNALFNALIFKYIFGSDHATYGALAFVIELSIATRIILKLESISEDYEGSQRWVLLCLVDLFDEALAVAVGFAWIGLFRNLFDALVFQMFDEEVPESDDISWLEEEEEDEHGGLKSKQVITVWVWYLVVVGVSFFLFVIASLKLSQKEKVNREPSCWDKACCKKRNLEDEAVKRLQKRRRAVLLLDALSLAVGFATEKSVGESLIGTFGEGTVSSIAIRAALSVIMLIGLFIQHQRDDKKGGRVKNPALQEQLLAQDEDNFLEDDEDREYEEVGEESEIKEAEVEGEEEDSEEYEVLESSVGDYSETTASELGPEEFDDRDDSLVQMDGRENESVTLSPLAVPGDRTDNQDSGEWL